jgi:hypothetical protein
MSIENINKSLDVNAPAVVSACLINGVAVLKRGRSRVSSLFLAKSR